MRSIHSSQKKTVGRLVVCRDVTIANYTYMRCAIRVFLLVQNSTIIMISNRFLLSFVSFGFFFFNVINGLLLSILFVSFPTLLSHTHTCEHSLAHAIGIVPSSFSLSVCANVLLFSSFCLLSLIRNEMYLMNKTYVRCEYNWVRWIS